jgi:hypothetical protein
MADTIVLVPAAYTRFFHNPGGIALELAAWTRELPREGDVTVEPVHAKEAARARDLAPAK